MSTKEPQTAAVASETADKSALVSAAAPKKSGKGKRILMTILLAGVALGGYEGYSWWTHGRFFESTDDAYVSADITTVLTKVSGYVSRIHKGDNEAVKAGDILVEIEDGDYRLAVEAAKDSLDTAKAAVQRITQQISAGQASVHQAEAELRSTQAALESAKLTYKRQQSLLKSSVASQASLDTARTAHMAAMAVVDKAKASIELAKANVGVLESQKKEAVRSVEAAETSLEKAKRDLGFTVVRAPVDGVLGNRAAQVGSFMQAGSRVGAIVPLGKAHVDANFKETQLDHISQGATVSISVDAYPDAVLTGYVESISPATGSVFSLLPSENATGNFTKVVQRVPVKIVVDPHDAADHPLRVGMSVIVDVDTRTGSSDLPADALALR